MNVRRAIAPESRYELLVKIAAGGMATVYVARLRTGQGVSRLVAVKRAHPHLAEDHENRSMLIGEARLGARIHHANVVAVQDVEELDGDLLIVMDYVEGAALSELLPLPGDPSARIALAVRMVLDAAAGLHAAHELTDEHEQPLAIIHRDVSPHNLLVGLDGVTRVTDFGVAKSNQSSVVTTTGVVKGKLAYMAPEYLTNGIADRRIDIFGLGVVLWESLLGKRLFKAPTEEELLDLVERCEPPVPSTIDPSIPPEIDAVVMKALERDPAQRIATAADFRDSLERAARAAGMLATHAEVAAMVAEQRKEPLAERRAAIRASSAAAPITPITTSTFSRELEQRDAEATASMSMPTPQPLPPSAAAPIPRDIPRRSHLLPLVAGVVLVAALIGGWRLSRTNVDAPPSPAATEMAPIAPPPPAPAMTPAPVVSSAEPIVVAAPAPVPSAKRGRTRPAPAVAPQPSADTVILPARDRAKPNPYHDAGG